MEQILIGCLAKSFVNGIFTVVVFTAKEFDQDMHKYIFSFVIVVSGVATGLVWGWRGVGGGP